MDDKLHTEDTSVEISDPVQNFQEDDAQEGDGNMQHNGDNTDESASGPTSMY